MIVITTPTGDIGGQVLAQVLDGAVLDGAADHGEQVRVVVRDPGRLPEGVAGRVEVVVGSHGDPDVVDQAFAGADAAFWCVPPNPRAPRFEDVYTEFSGPACEAFKRHGVGRVVGISALGRGTPVAGRAGLVTASLAMDDQIAATGAGYRALIMPSFMDNTLRQVEAIKNQGVFYSTSPGDMKLPTCATRDIAAAATRLLFDRSWSGAGSVAVLGPEDLSFDDMAQIMSSVLARPVRYQRIPVEGLRQMMLDRGASEAGAQGMADMMTAKNEGLDNAEPRTPESTTPTTFRQWCEQILAPAVG
ncbi:MAG TPA: NAD(P)H-binding protein [Streptosporangiaceae bacterium]|jgi:uncharacterized protein YbjT (DUF2867 family)